MSFVLGTAGHVDHGKTTLVRALTGIDTDRLPEEKARGISIELGFAWLDVAGERVAFVDVPGHERFVRQMIAGAAGIDAVVLVVAADEGVMPQTREHLAITSLLGISRGFVVITKVDLVAPEWLALVVDDVASLVRGTFLEGAPALPFTYDSAEMRATVIRAIAELVHTAHTSNDALSRADRPFVLPFDRIFAQPGFGTIVTGTSTAGEVAVGDEVVVYPGGETARVRALEIHGERVARAGPGVRLAANLPGLALATRAGVVVHPDGPRPTLMIDATWRPLPGLPSPIADGERGLLHIGTERVEATLALLSHTDSASRCAQLRLASPVVFLPGTPYVFRGFRTWPGRPDLGQTLGGGRALAPSTRRRRRGPEAEALVAQLAARAPEAALVAYVGDHGEDGLPAPALAARLPWPRATIDSVVRDARASGVLLDLAPDRLVAAAKLEPLQRALVATLDQVHRESPHEPGVSEQELWTRVRSSSPAELVALAITRLVAAGEVVRVAGTPPTLARAGHRPALGADPAVLDRLATQFETLGLSPPDPRELLLPDGTSASQAIDTLVRAQRLVRVSRDLVFASTALADLTARARAWFATHEWLDAQDLKQLVGASRKFAIPLGEWLDRARVTVRVGDRRRLRA